jgi:hypothetical protein
LDPDWLLLCLQIQNRVVPDAKGKIHSVYLGEPGAALGNVPEVESEYASEQNQAGVFKNWLHARESSEFQKGLTMEQKAEKFETWAIVEILGRQSFAGLVTEQMFSGASMIRVDVPSVDGSPAFTKLFGVGSIYAITPTTEDVVRRYVGYHRPVPMTAYIPPAQQLQQYEETEEEIC